MIQQLNSLVGKHGGSYSFALLGRNQSFALRPRRAASTEDVESMEWKRKHLLSTPTVLGYCPQQRERARTLHIFFRVDYVRCLVKTAHRLSTVVLHLTLGNETPFGRYFE